MKKSKRTPAKRVTREQVNPDGVVLTIDWDRMKVGMSVFIPAFNTSKLRAQCRDIAKLRGWEFDFRNWVEGGIAGLRVWRIL